MAHDGSAKVVRSRTAAWALCACVLAVLPTAAGAQATAAGGQATAAGAQATPAGAQERPDFSGHWTSTSQGRGGPAAGAGQGATGSLGSGWGSTFTIEQDADTLTVTRVFFSRSDFQPPIKYRFALDGSQTTNGVLMGRGVQEQTSTTRWEGNSLVITTTYDVSLNPGGQRILCEVTHTLSLRPPSAGRAAWPPSLVVETVRGGVLGGPSSTTRTVYDRN